VTHVDIARTLDCMPAPRTALPVVSLDACCAPLGTDVPDRADSEILAAAFRALGDPVRLRLLSLLLTAPGGEVCACDLVEPLERSQPTVSHHLKVLREAGLVTATRRGANVWYAARAEQLVALRAVLGA
jgi:ArsR family transcriptional regulator